MPTSEERLAVLEERVHNHAEGLAGIRSEIGDLRTEMKALRAEMEIFRKEMRAEMDAFRAEIRSYVQRLEDKVDRQFRWIVGLQMSTLIAVIGALAAALYR